MIFKFDNQFGYGYGDDDGNGDELRWGGLRRQRREQQQQEQYNNRKSNYKVPFELNCIEKKKRKTRMSKTEMGKAKLKANTEQNR